MAANVENNSSFRVLPSDPSEVRLWVVSSIEGNLDKLEEAILEIESHSNFCEDDKVIFMGGFIGEGLDNRKIIESLRDYQKARPKQVVILRGPEEHKFLNSKQSFFKSAIGKSLINSYREKNFFQTTVCKNQKLMTDRDWIGTLPSIYKTNRYFFVYSGVISNTELDKQSPVVTMFLHDCTFKQSDEQFSKVIVHNHTTNEYKSNRIGISTGLVVLNDTKANSKILELNA